MRFVLLPACLQALSRYSTAKKEKSSLHTLHICLVHFVCGFGAMRLQSVATNHILSSVIYVHKKLDNGVWKLEMEVLLGFVRLVKQQQT